MEDRERKYGGVTARAAGATLLPRGQSHAGSILRARRPLAACGSIGRAVLRGWPASGARGPSGRWRRGEGRLGRGGAEGGTPGHLALLGITKSVRKGAGSIAMVGGGEQRHGDRRDPPAAPCRRRCLRHPLGVGAGEAWSDGDAGGREDIFQLLGTARRFFWGFFY